MENLVFTRLALNLPVSLVLPIAKGDLARGDRQDLPLFEYEGAISASLTRSLDFSYQLYIDTTTRSVAPLEA